MPTLVRQTWDPFDTVRSLLEWDAAPARAAVYQPRFDVRETPEAYLFQADLPGVAEKDLEVTLTGTRLTVSGKRQAETRKDGERWFTAERNHGSFTRSFELPEHIDGEKIAAELNSGVLTLRVPKRPANQPRKIALKGDGAKA
jgi:HSP20 family protein